MNPESAQSSSTNWEADAVHEAYAQYEDSEAVHVYKEQKQEYAAALTQWDNYINTADEQPLTESELDEALTTRAELLSGLIEASANYPGDWTKLLYERMSDPVSKEKFIAQRMEAMPEMKEGAVSLLSKETEYKSHYLAQIDTYDERLAHIFSQTQVERAERDAHTLGTNTLNQPGTVFLDAEAEGVPLTPRQKNIIEAHEKGHGLRDFQSPSDKAEIASVIDQAVLQQLLAEYRTQEQAGSKARRFNANYIKEPEEIIERMAQFKNYFGMEATEPFTSKHLAYLREQYVADTGLDNSVTDLLHCITPRTEAAFLKVINTYPI